MDPHPRYQMLEKIGSGSFATVYRGRDLELGREVAIKQIHEQFLENPQQLDRYWQEAQLLASFQHPNIVTIYDIVRERGWLIMELMQGNLSKLSSKKPMDLNALRTTLAHCLRALKFLHAHGIVHGDIKPANMMIDRRRRVKIGDFGLARRVSDDDGSLIKGTTKYMAPEVVSDEFGVVGPASDLYSLGFAAYELMCGANFESLFPGLSAFGRDKQIAWMMWHAAPDRRLPEVGRVLEDVPEDLARTIQKLTAKPQTERYKTADEALSDLNIDIKLVTTGGGGGEPAPTDADAKRKRMLAIGAFSGSVLLSLIALLMPSGKQDVSNPVDTIEPTRGIVRKVFLSPPKVEIEDEAGLPSEILVGEKPRIFLNQFSKEKDEYILLRDLKEGDRVEVKNEKDPQGRTVINIIALRPERSRGQIKSVDVPDSEFLLTLDEKHEDIPLRVPRAAKVWLNGLAASLNELRADDRAEVSHLKDTQARGMRVVIRLDALRTVKLTGFVSGIDVKKKLLTVTPAGGGGAGSKKIVLEFAEPCKIRINGKESANGRGFGPEDIKDGDRVIVQHDTRITEAEVSRRDRVSGTLIGINEETRTVNVRTDESKLFEFVLGPACEVNLGGEPAQIIDLRKDDILDVTFDERTGEPGLARTVDARRPTKPDRLVILIGEQNYTDRNLSRLKYAGADAKLLQETLIKRYGVAPNRILLLADANREEIQHSVVEWLRKTSNLTQVLVYFSGHAYTDTEGHICLAPSDLAWNDLAGTGLRLDWLVEQLEVCIAREKILLLDASHAGSGPDLARQPSTAEMIESLKAANPPVVLKSVEAIASCNKEKAGQDWNEKQHGLFAYVLSEAFSGRADKDKDLVIDARELFEYLKNGMTKPAVDGQPTQTPVLFMP